MDMAFAYKILSTCDGCSVESLSEKNQECITSPTVGIICEEAANLELKSQKVNPESINLCYQEAIAWLDQPIVDIEPSVHSGLNLIQKSLTRKLVLEMYLGYYFAVKNANL